MKETFTEKLIREKHDRERSCFRACAGIPDPESVVPELKDFVRETHALLTGVVGYENFTKFSDAAGGDMGNVLGLLSMAQALLPKLKPQGPVAQLTEDGKEGE